MRISARIEAERNMPLRERMAYRSILTILVPLALAPAACTTTITGAGTGGGGSGPFEYAGSAGAPSSCDTQTGTAPCPCGEPAPPAVAATRSGPLPQNAFHASLDGAGDLLVIGPASLESWADVVVSKLDPTGTQTSWSRTFHGTNTETSLQVFADAAGNVYFGGAFAGTLDLGGAPLVSFGDLPDYFVAKLDPDGNPLWRRQIGGMDWEDALAMAVEPVTGDIVLTGGLAGPIDFGGGPVGEPHAPAIGKLDTDGAHVWSVGFAIGEEGDIATGVAVAIDAAGDVVVGGALSGTLYIGADTLWAEQGMFLTRLSPGGAPIWSQGFPHLSLSQGSPGAELSTDAAGKSVFAASLGADTWIERQDSLGAIEFDGKLDAWPVAISAVPDGRTVIAGNFKGKNVDGTPSELGDDSDFALGVLGPDGKVLQGASSYGGPGYARVNVIAVDGSSRFVVVGQIDDCPIDMGNGPIPPGPFFAEFPL